MYSRNDQVADGDGNDVTMDGTPTNKAYVDTDQVHVTMKMRSGVEVDGHVHIRPDGYQSRVSDLLNRANFSFLPVTGATLHRTDGSRQSAACIIVGTEEIELVICHDEEDGPSTAELLEAARPAGEAAVADHELDDSLDVGQRGDW